MGLPSRKTWRLSVLMARLPTTGMAVDAAVAEDAAFMPVRRMLAFTRAMSSRMEKGLVM